MDHKLKEIVLNYFTDFCADDIQAIIAKYEGQVNADERIRERLSQELDRCIRDAADNLPVHVAPSDSQDNSDSKFLKNLLNYICDSLDSDDLVTFISWN